MRLLALESSSRLCSVALYVDGTVQLRCAPEDARNSEVLLPLVQSLLAEAQCPLGTLDAIAFGAGPGAFTGLRVACGAAQGLAFGADLPVVAVGTLDVLAEAVRQSAGQVAGAPLQVLAALDARMGELYWAELSTDGPDWQATRGPLLCQPAAVPWPSAGRWHLVGEAFSVYPELLAGAPAGSVMPDPAWPLLPRADLLARLAVVRFDAGLAVAPEHAQPLYVREKVAQTQAERDLVRGGAN